MRTAYEKKPFELWRIKINKLHSGKFEKSNKKLY